MDDFVRSQMLYHIQRAVKNWGIEGTEQKLKEIYKNHPHMQFQYLSVFYEIYPFFKK